MITLPPRVTRLTTTCFLLALALPIRFFAQNLSEVYDLYVYDAMAKPVVGAEVDLTPCGQNLQYTGSDGALRFVLPRGADCYMTVRKQGFQEAINAVRSGGPHQISVGLEPDRSGQFSGRVFDGASGGPMVNAVVYARSTKDNHWTRATTDDSGRYVLRLNPLQEYTITYAQYGYEDAHSTVQTARNLSGVIALPEAELRPGASAFMPWLTQHPSAVPTPASGYAAFQPGTMDGYSIQLASGLPNLTDIGNRYGELAAYGNLYYKPVGDRYQIRLGVYATQREAQAVVDRIVQKYSGVLAVAEQGVSEKMFVLNSPPADLLAPASVVASTSPAAQRVIIYPQAAPAQYNTYDSPVAPVQYAKAAVPVASGPPAAAPPAAAPPSTTYPKVTIYTPPVIRPIESSASTLSALPKPVSAPVQYTAQAPVGAPVQYAVQVGSYSADRAVPINEFAVLGELGHTYAKMENGLLKVRLGVWADYNRAEAAKTEAVRRGFRDATVVTEKSADPELQAFQLDNNVAEYALIPISMLIADATPAQYSTTAITSTPVVEDPSYYIRIAALSNPGRFDPKPYQDLGNFEMRPLSNGMTLVLLGRYLTPEDALAAQGELRRRGYNEPYAVRDDNGRMEKVR